MQSCRILCELGAIASFHIMYYTGGHHLQLCHGSEAIECSYTMGSGAISFSSTMG